MNAARRLAIFIGLNALGLGLIVGLVLAPASAFLQGRQAKIDYKVSRLARVRSALAQSAAEGERERRDLAGTAARFIRGDDTSLMNADLLTRLRGIAERRSVVFASFATLPPRDWSGRQLVGARIEFSGLSGAVSAILADIEAGKVFLFIEKAHLTTARIDEGDETVSVSLDVYGATE